MKDIFESHPVSVLKKEISKTNIKGYSKMKKSAVIELMLKNKDRFTHIKMAEKKDRKKPVKQEKKPDKVKVKPEKKPDKVKVKSEKKPAPAKPAAAKPAPAKPKAKKEKKPAKTSEFKSFTDKLYANQARKKARQKKKDDDFFDKIFGSKN